MGTRKRYTPEEKVSILREALEGRKSMSSVALEHGVHPNMLLNWRKQLFEGATGTFIVKRPDVSEKAAERRARELEEELARKDRQRDSGTGPGSTRVKKKESWPEVGKRKMSLEKRQLIAGEVKRIHRLTGIAILTLVVFAGVPKRTWGEWQERSGQETRHNGILPRDHWLTPEETQAILDFCGERIPIGYRPLCYEMLDAGVAAVSPASVYNVLKRHDMTKQWAELKEDGEKGFTQPAAVHELRTKGPLAH